MISSQNTMNYLRNRFFSCSRAGRPAALLVAVVMFVVVALAVPAATLAAVGEGDRAAELVGAKDAKGRKVRLKSYRDKIVVVTFGASWCEPCKKELPAWEKLAKKYKGQGVVFLAVNIDKDLAKGKQFVKQAKLSAMRAVYEPDGASVESYDPPSMPTTYVIDQKGIVKHRHAGYRSGDDKKLAKMLDELLGK